jgi:hypothetical protein
MAEIRAVGHDGNADFDDNDHNAKLATWSASFPQIVTDVSAFQDTWAVSRGGRRSGRFSAGGVMSYNIGTSAPQIAANTSGTNQLDPAGVNVTLTVAPGCTYEGTAVVSNASINSDSGGAARISFDGTFTGLVTETWDEITSA